jgi:hypothetical protein
LRINYELGQWGEGVRGGKSSGEGNFSVEI